MVLSLDPTPYIGVFAIAFSLFLICIYCFFVSNKRTWRTKLAGLADSIANCTQDRTKKGDWQNVAWNLDPNKGSGGRKVSRSFAGY